MIRKDLTGKTFGRLTVISLAQDKPYIKPHWVCKCSCGKEKVIWGSSLLVGDTKSCGCLKISKRGPENHMWKGGRRKSKGYILLWEPTHPNANCSGYVLEHVKVMSSYIRRPLCKGETVHHRNGIKDDNRLVNLEIWLTNHPTGQRIQDLVSFAKEILKKYKKLSSLERGAE